LTRKISAYGRRSRARCRRGGPHARWRRDRGVDIGPSRWSDPTQDRRLWPL